MNGSTEPTPLERKKRAHLVIRIVGLVVLAGAVALLGNNLPLLGSVAAAVVLLVVTAFYMVEVQYSRALASALGQRTVAPAR